MIQNNNVIDALTGSNNVYQADSDLPLLDHLNNRSIPNIDFSNLSNFIKFGSAAEYYKNCIEYINTTYPYDGTKTEKLSWENALSDFEYYVFLKEYPRYVGHLQLAQDAYIEASLNTLEQRQIEPGQGLNQFQYETNIELELGFTVEMWLRADNATDVLKIFNINGPVIIDENNPIPVFYDLVRITKESGIFKISNSANSQYIEIPVNKDITKWHHYAFSFIPGNLKTRVKAYADGVLYYDQENDFKISINNRKIVPLGLIWVPLSRITPINISSPIQSKYKFGGVGGGAISLDEIRLWKTVRTDEQIKLFWFTDVDGT